MKSSLNFRHSLVNLMKSLKSTHIWVIITVSQWLATDLMHFFWISTHLLSQFSMKNGILIEISPTLISINLTPSPKYVHRLKCECSRYTTMQLLLFTSLTMFCAQYIMHASNLNQNVQNAFNWWVGKSVTVVIGLYSICFIIHISYTEYFISYIFEATQKSCEYSLYDSEKREPRRKKRGENTTDPISCKWKRFFWL